MIFLWDVFFHGTRYSNWLELHVFFHGTSYSNSRMPSSRHSVEENYPLRAEERFLPQHILHEGRHIFCTFFNLLADEYANCEVVAKLAIALAVRTAQQSTQRWALLLVTVELLTARLSTNPSTEPVRKFWRLSLTYVLRLLAESFSTAKFSVRAQDRRS